MLNKIMECLAGARQAALEGNSEPITVGMGESIEYVAGRRIGFLQGLAHAKNVIEWVLEKDLTQNESL